MRTDGLRRVWTQYDFETFVFVLGDKETQK
jgi:hypothetical protein